MIKLVFLLKRRPDLSMAEFIDYYEQVHSKLGEALFTGVADRYVRRYLTPVPAEPGAPVEEKPYDAIMEIWFADEAKFGAAMAAAGAPEALAARIADEHKLFDVSKIRAFTVDERDSDVRR